ncbi:hypothetical protein Pcinc_010926 [Petrolisthes cinctipes]|uniref:Torsin-1A-interacting protein 1/2 AAA+ activator domain-containing protein n=1 Tax=Petrolisthes cinctipes TaxID=88211 RepID=A0AAE1G2A0_PETCI|nr:hypothetical protein Pcinc_010926 [Petrolisthes cinctipes]
MNEPKVSKSEVTSRRRLRNSNTSISSRVGMSGQSLHTHSQAAPKNSPHSQRVRCTLGESEEDSGDEVDNTTAKFLRSSPLHQSHGLYPTLDPYDENLSPISNSRSGSEPGSPYESFGSSRSDCYPQTTPASGKKLRKEPVTPIKGSPGKKIDTVVHEGISTQSHRGASPLLYIFVFTLGIIGVLLLQFKLMNDETKIVPASPTKSIKEIHSDLKNKLRLLNQELSQPRELWVQLIGQLGSVMVDKPQQPAVLLVVMPQESKATVVCLVHKIAEAIRDAFEDTRFVMYDAHTNRITDPRALKREIDESLQNLNQAHAAVVHHIEEVPGQAAMIFHAYCDNENAPFKQAVIFPVMEVPGSYNTVASSNLDEVASGRLMKIWGVQLGVKDVSAIVSRIANAPILIKPESRSTIQRLCPPV